MYIQYLEEEKAANQTEVPVGAITSEDDFRDMKSGDDRKPRAALGIKSELDSGLKTAPAQEQTAVAGFSLTDSDYRRRRFLSDEEHHRQVEAWNDTHYGNPVDMVKHYEESLIHPPTDKTLRRVVESVELQDKELRRYHADWSTQSEAMTEPTNQPILKQPKLSEGNHNSSAACAKRSELESAVRTEVEKEGETKNQPVQVPVRAITKSEDDHRAIKSDNDSKPSAIKQEQESTVVTESLVILTKQERRRRVEAYNDALYGNPVDLVREYEESAKRSDLDNALLKLYASQEYKADELRRSRAHRSAKSEPKEEAPDQERKPKQE